MDFGFMRASAWNFLHPYKTKDHMVYSYNGFSSYLVIVDEACCYVWVSFTTSKDPPLDLIAKFLTQHGHENGRCILTNQGGELARSHAFQNMLLRNHHYTLEPTGSDSPSKIGGPTQPPCAH
jgi:hypothetical protein